MTPQGWKISFMYETARRLSHAEDFEKIYEGSIAMGESEWMAQNRQMFEWLDHHHRFSNLTNLRIVIHNDFPRITSVPSLEKPGYVKYEMTWPAPIVWTHTGPKGMVSTNLEMSQYTLITGDDMREILAEVRQLEARQSA